MALPHEFNHERRRLPRPARCICPALLALPRHACIHARMPRCHVGWGGWHRECRGTCASLWEGGWVSRCSAKGRALCSILNIPAPCALAGEDQTRFLIYIVPIVAAHRLLHEYNTINRGHRGAPTCTPPPLGHLRAKGTIVRPKCHTLEHPAAARLKPFWPLSFAIACLPACGASWLRPFPTRPTHSL